MSESSQKIVTLDETDRAILKELQRNGRIRHTELSGLINLSAPALHARIRRLEQSGLIRGYVALLDRELAGYDMLVVVHVTTALHQYEHLERFRATLAAMPEVLECLHVTGEYDYLLKVAIRHRSDLENFVVHKLSPIPGVTRVRTSLVLREIKSTTALPLE